MAVGNQFPSVTSLVECDQSSRSHTSPACGILPQNISSEERVYSAAANAGLLLAVVARGRWSGLMLSGLGGGLLYLAWTGHCHAYNALGINTSERPSATAVPAQQGMKCEKAIVVNRSPEDLFAFWKELTNLPRVMRHLKSVQMLGQNRSRWVALGPLDMPVEWDAEILEERAPEMIAWRSLPDSQMDTAGSVHFRPLGHDCGTEVRLSLKYNPPGGKVGAAIANLLGGELEQQVSDDLRRFKSTMEAGECSTVDKISFGTTFGKGLKMAMGQTHVHNYLAFKETRKRQHPWRR